ncbi:sigma factor [Nonomuraea sp. LPB2021202275-12-8]|uniref:sigma factor n=1 Tax=Nonomuraea sp. LPB2021202275-12-8 TaxID=3120159 RepID=UPI00300DA53F
MNGSEFLADRFEAHRAHLRAVAYRMLGSASEADDALQEAWLRVSRAGADDVANLGGWLTTIVARVSLHDMFAVPFDEIAPIVGRSPGATRQLASRARRRVQVAAPAPDPGLARRREIVAAFLAASRGGDFAALLELLDPDVVLRADGAAVHAGAEERVHGALAVATAFSGRARAAQLALVDGDAGAVWAPGGAARVVVGFTITDGRITAIDLLADSDHLRELDLVIGDPLG